MQTSQGARLHLGELSKETGLFYSSFIGTVPFIEHILCAKCYASWCFYWMPRLFELPQKLVLGVVTLPRWGRRGRKVRGLPGVPQCGAEPGRARGRWTPWPALRPLQRPGRPFTPLTGEGTAHETRPGRRGWVAPVCSARATWPLLPGAPSLLRGQGCPWTPSSSFLGRGQSS